MSGIASHSLLQSPPMGSNSTIFMRDTPWKMWDILAVDDHHIITKRKWLWDNTRIDDVLTNSHLIAHIRFEEFGYDIDEFTPICGQLLDYAEAIQITETANPDVVPFLFDLSADEEVRLQAQCPRVCR